MAATALEIYKAQAQVLVPVVRELKAQIGEAKTHQIIRKALGEHFRNFGKVAFPTMKGENFGEKVHSLMDMFATEGALDWNINQKSDKELNFTVTGCRYAEFYKELGAPELGFMLVCGQDYPFTEGMDERAVLERPTTIMQGNGRCEFRWYLAKDQAEAQQKREAEESKNNAW
jgi:hypothetical protein